MRADQITCRAIAESLRSRRTTSFPGWAVVAALSLVPPAAMVRLWRGALSVHVREHSRRASLT